MKIDGYLTKYLYYEKMEKGQGTHILKTCLFWMTYLWIIFIIIIWVIPFCFIVIHELSHAIVAKMVGCEVLDIIIEYPGTSRTIILEGTPAQMRLISIAGTLGSFTISFTLNRIVYHKKKILCLVFIPLYIGTWSCLLYELQLWTTNSLKHSGDAGVFLDYSPGIDATILSSFFLLVFFYFFIWFLINFLEKLTVSLERSSMWIKIQNKLTIEFLMAIK